MLDYNALAIRAIQSEKERTALLQNSEQFILKCAYKATKHYVTKSDDEWSIALIAFSQAIDSYQLEKGHFLSYAELLIRHRLTDYYRNQSKYASEINIAPEIIDGNLDESEEEMPYHLHVIRQTIENRPQSLRDEIMALDEELHTYGITFMELAEVSPKKEKTKKECAKAVACILQMPELLKELEKKGLLPIKAIEKEKKVPRKIMERHRKYIIAATIIVKGDYPGLSEYMKYIREEMKS